MAITDLQAVSKVQPMREGEIDAIDLLNQILSNFPLTTNDIADLAITTVKLAALAVDADKLAANAVSTDKIVDGAVDADKLAANAVSTDKIVDGAVDADKLAQSIQQQITFLQSIPTLTYGESSAVTVSANSTAIVDITFSEPLTEAPNVYCMPRSTVCVECNVTQVTNQQVSITLYNNTNTDAEQVSIDWLAISGR